MSMRRRLLSSLLVIVLGAGATWGYLYIQGRGSSPKYRLAKVERGPLTATVSAPET